ncbi:MAG: PaaI family thioesterase [Roseovarius sp.]
MSLRIATQLEDVADMSDVSARSGLEFMTDVLNGTLAVPPIGQTLGFWPTEVAPGRVAFEGASQFNGANVMRATHGGWYGAILDSAMGCAVMTELPQGKAYTTLEFKVNITRALPIGMQVRAVGIVHHAGRSTAVATGEVRGIDNDTLYATGTTTCMIMSAV